MNYPRNHSSSVLCDCPSPERSDGDGAAGLELTGVKWPGSCQTAMILRPWSSGLYMSFLDRHMLRDYGEIIFDGEDGSESHLAVLQAISIT